MSKKVVYIFISLLCAFFVGIFAGYMYKNNVSSQIEKNLTFNDLPSSVQSKYIKKEDAQELSSYMSIKTENVKPINAPIEGTNDELKAQIQELRTTNQSLYKENIELSNKGWDLAIKLKEAENKIVEEKERLKAKNLENINESEKQHYKNVNDLTKRINELQQEAIESTQAYESQIVSLENKIDELKQSLQKKDFDINKEISVATKKERINNSTLAEKNRYLLEQINVMKDKMTAQFDENTKNLQAKKDEISNLKKAINVKDAQRNMLLTKHTKEILDMEQKNALVLRNLKEKIAQLQKKHKDELSKKNNEITTLLNKKKEDVEQLRQNIENNEIKFKNALSVANKDKQISLETIDTLKKKNQRLNKENEELSQKINQLEEKTSNILEQKEQQYASMLQDIKKQTLNKKDKENQTIVKLERQILEDASNIESLKATNQKLNEEKQALKAKLDTGIQKEEFDKNEAKHAKNYKLFNSKITTLKNEYNTYTQQASKKIQELEAKLNKKNDVSIKKELKNKNNTIQEQNTKIVTLNEKIATLEKKIKQISGSNKTKEKKDEKETLQLKKNLEYKDAKIASLKDDISIFKKEKEALVEENKNLKRNFDENIQDKLSLKTQELEENRNVINDLKDTIITLKNQNLKLSKENETLNSKKEQNYTSLQSQLKQTQQDLQSSQDDLMSLKGDLAVLKKQNEDLIAEKTKLASLNAIDINKSKKDYDTLVNNLRNRHAEILALKNEFNSIVKKNLELKDENERLKNTITLSQTNTKDQMETSTKNTTKPMLEASIKCDDMPKGTNEPTLTCKKRVKEFLTKFNESYFFEIVPIVDNGGFASLNKVAKSKLNISKNEINRLTRLSNIGLGKDRAAAGGTLVKEIFGDNVIISYSVSNQDIPKKRGFIINAYK